MFEQPSTLEGTQELAESLQTHRGPARMNWAPNQEMAGTNPRTDKEPFKWLPL